MAISVEKIEELLQERKLLELKEILSNENEMDIAENLDRLSSEEVIKVFRLLPKDTAADVFASVSSEHQKHIIECITDSELKSIVDDLFIDDAVDMIEELPANVVRRVLENSSSDTRLLINQYLNYPENSAGSIMTAEYIGLKKHMSVKECFEYIRKHAIQSETIYTCYVIDQSRKLEGVVTIKDLFLENYNSIVGDIMDENVIKAHTNDDQEQVVEIFNKYDLLSLPVVDSENRLVGIVTIDDALDVMEQEATEDFEKMSAISPSEKPYLKTSSWLLAKNRVVWLTLLMLSDTIAGTILRHYEDAFAVMPLLVTFIPMLIDTGGNAGSQSSTMIIRGMAIGEINIKDFFKVIFKEFQVGLITGFILGAVNFIRLILLYPGKTLVILTIVTSIYVIVIISKIIGAILPLIAKLFKFDPAIMAAPLITTIIDALGLIVYFELATYFLHI